MQSKPSRTACRLHTNRGLASAEAVSQKARRSEEVSPVRPRQPHRLGELSRSRSQRRGCSRLTRCSRPQRPRLRPERWFARSRCRGAEILLGKPGQRRCGPGAELSPARCARRGSTPERSSGRPQRRRRPRATSRSEPQSRDRSRETSGGRSRLCEQGDPRSRPIRLHAPLHGRPSALIARV